MSRFFSSKYDKLVPYVPGEQPKDNADIVKLNTNESPFPPHPAVAAAVAEECGRLNLYSDPECALLHSKIAELYGVKPSQVLATNGSDEALNCAFLAFGDANNPLAFPDVTYGFYPVFAALDQIPYEEIPVREDLSVCPEDYMGIHKTVVLANPNAPTGMALGLDAIEAIVRSNPDNVVVIDEAYVDFGSESAVKLVDRYENLLVIQTFSKSRSMAGARLGFAIGNEKLIADMNTIKYSTNPYNVNRMTAAAGCAALAHNEYYMANCRVIMENRSYTTQALRELGFEVLDSRTNFVFARSNKLSGEELNRRLKEKNILVRRFQKERIRDYLRISIGTREQMERLVQAAAEILEDAT